MHAIFNDGVILGYEFMVKDGKESHSSLFPVKKEME